MPSMFQQALAKAHPLQGRMLSELPAEPEDDDVALGFECANPVLQFEGWEPQPQAATLHY